MIVPILAISITALFVLLMLSQEDEFGWPYGGDDNTYEDDIFDDGSEHDPYGESDDDSDGNSRGGDCDTWQNGSATKEDNHDT